mmetsp:Transcript_5914/g.14225  ORF Transcript_5914/g.14225 Transcript_5914/m.14225 type:complete len:101 (-) Transcript_5914:2690-2992(-)
MWWRACSVQAWCECGYLLSLQWYTSEMGSICFLQLAAMMEGGMKKSIKLLLAPPSPPHYCGCGLRLAIEPCPKWDGRMEAKGVSGHKLLLHPIFALQTKQ